MITTLLIILLKKYLPGIFSKLAMKIQNVNHLQILSGIFFQFLILVPCTGYAQKFSYAVLKGSKQIGNLSVKCVKSDKQTIYSIWSMAKTGFILTVDINVLIDEVFEMGEMKQSMLVRKINGREVIKNTAYKFGKGYIVKSEDDDLKYISKEINYTMAAMYFIEPLKMDSVYSENYRQFIPLSRVGQNCYLIKFPDGNKSYYTYTNSICTTVEAHTKLAVIFFKLNEKLSLDTVFNETKD